MEGNSVEIMHSMLTYRRPHRSKSERRFIKEFISDLGVKPDKYGNRILRLGDAPVMYSCHTDSVHRSGGRQAVVADSKNMQFTLHPHAGADSNCLGADNAAGVWIMRELILAKKPGLYVFHRGEECGGLGSRFLTKNTPNLVKDIKAAIAFDRRNTKSIITFQAGGRCCSNAFADSLAKELKLGHNKDMGGSFTDTANYTDLIPECTNVSVGFDSEHTSRECLDMKYLAELRHALIEMNYDNLVIERKAGDKEPRTYYYEYKYTDDYVGNTSYYKGHSHYKSGQTPWWKAPEYKNRYAFENGKFRLADDSKKPMGFLEDKTKDQKELPLGEDEAKEKLRLRTQRDQGLICKMVKANPFIITLLLEDNGETMDSVADYIYKYDGAVPQEVIQALTFKK